MRWMTLAALLATAAVTFSASAQVHKCKDATGKTIYTDAPCAANQSGALIERQRTQREIYLERMQAAEANDRKYERHLAEQQREQSERSTRVQVAPSARQVGGSWQERNAARNARVSAGSITNSGGKWDEVAEQQQRYEKRARAEQEPLPLPPSSPPSQLTSCHGSICHDTQGGVYHRVGPSFMTGPNGKSCNRSGSTWVCN